MYSTFEPYSLATSSGEMGRDVSPSRGTPLFLFALLLGSSSLSRVWLKSDGFAVLVDSFRFMSAASTPFLNSSGGRKNGLPASANAFFLTSSCAKNLLHISLTEASNSSILISPGNFLGWRFVIFFVNFLTVFASEEAFLFFVAAFVMGEGVGDRVGDGTFAWDKAAGAGECHPGGGGGDCLGDARDVAASSTPS
ncbi:hypothetical protein PVAP13_6KG137618 [Panicum virgatum]|uniref:Uncharacterized protein n=1 Tax=Panicum virgatum TaxID=38727 RepID=A0A8T0RE02_PANVG|nr:hypothetical protein PVAP13_6KG137618 [Panicum virgatum]